MIGVAIVALLTLSAVGSLLWALPTKADRRRAGMRADAMQKGLSVTTLSVPDTSDRGRIDNKRRLVTLYKKRSREAPAVRPFTVLRSLGECGFGLPDGWVWEDPSYRLRGEHRQRLETLLGGLPEWVEIVAVMPDGLAVGFNERRGDDQVVQVKSLLDEHFPVFFMK